MSDINLTCDVCGREVKGYTWVNGMKFCAKCYRETFGNNTSQFVDLLNKEMYELKIAYLEAKLAEKEKEYKESVEKILSSRDKFILEYTQDKISFAVEKIQELKKSLRDKVCLMENDEHCYPQNAVHWQDVVALIDNQIKELKNDKRRNCVHKRIAY